MTLNNHQPTANHQPNGRTSYLRECYQKRSTRFTTNHQQPTTNNQPPTQRENQLPARVLPKAQRWFTTNHQPPTNN
ncbi:MAG: hypothetical protein ACHBN1_14950 [Heteroscytonema crispum UTEX LB 1556]